MLCDEEGQKPVPGVGFSVAGLDRDVKVFCLLLHSDIDFISRYILSYILTNLNRKSVSGEHFIAIGQR